MTQSRSETRPEVKGCCHWKGLRGLERGARRPCRQSCQVGQERKDRCSPVAAFLRVSKVAQFHFDQNGHQDDGVLVNCVDHRCRDSKKAQDLVHSPYHEDVLLVSKLQYLYHSAVYYFYTIPSSYCVHSTSRRIPPVLCRTVSL